MHIAVTGGTGFLGRYLIRILAEAGHALRCWHRPTSDRTGLERWEDQLEWLPGSLSEREMGRDLVRGVDAVVHAAVDWERVGGVRGSGREDLTAFLETNLMGSVRLFEAARKVGVPRFIFISTCAVHEVILDDRPLDETHPLWPSRHYGAHKAALEKFVHSYGLGEGWPICALRPTGIYGLAHPPAASRWFDLVAQVVRGEPVESARGGKEVHALDVARAVQLLLTADPVAIAGQAFNCYDLYVAEQEVARLAKEISGSRSVIADVNRGPKHQIVNDKIRRLGMNFGGQALLRRTVQELVDAQVAACRSRSAPKIPRRG